MKRWKRCSGGQYSNSSLHRIYGSNVESGPVESQLISTDILVIAEEILSHDGELVTEKSEKSVIITI